jgi:hypothetical protein
MQDSQHNRVAPGMWTCARGIHHNCTLFAVDVDEVFFPAQIVGGVVETYDGVEEEAVVLKEGLCDLHLLVLKCSSWMQLHPCMEF